MRCGRKETRNKYSEEQRRAWERHAAGNGGRGPHRGLELELDGSPARKIHIFKYFSHGPQSPRHAALPPTACYPLRTYYLPGTCLGIAASTPRVSGFLVTRCRSLSPSLSLFIFLPLSLVTIRHSMAHNTQVLCLLASICVCFACIAVSHSSTFTGELLLVKRFDYTGKCNRRNRLHRCCDVVFDGRC